MQWHTHTGIFVLATLALGAELLYSANVAVSDNDQGLVDMADVLEDRYGAFMSKLFIVGFFSAAFSSCLGVWNGVSLMFADYIGHLKKDPARRSPNQYWWKVLPRLPHLANLPTNAAFAPWKANRTHHRLRRPGRFVYAVLRPYAFGPAEYQTHPKAMEKRLDRQHVDGGNLRCLRLFMCFPTG